MDNITGSLTSKPTELASLRPNQATAQVRPQNPSDILTEAKAQLTQSPMAVPYPVDRPTDPQQYDKMVEIFKNQPISVGTWRPNDHEVFAQGIKSAITTAFELDELINIDLAEEYEAMDAQTCTLGALKELYDNGNDAMKDFIQNKVLITGKNWCTSSGQPESMMSITKRQIESITANGKGTDSYLVHWPTSRSNCNPGQVAEDPSPGTNPHYSREDDNGVPHYIRLNQACQDGYATVPGVSNMNPKQLQEIFEKTGSLPPVIQIEGNLAFQNKELIDFCKNNGMAVQVYSCLGAQELAKVLLSSPIVTDIAQSHGLDKSEHSKVILAFWLQQGVTPIVAGKGHHLKDNIEACHAIKKGEFKLTDEEMDRLKSMSFEMQLVPAMCLKESAGYPHDEQWLNETIDLFKATHDGVSPYDNEGVLTTTAFADAAKQAYLAQKNNKSAHIEQTLSHIFPGKGKEALKLYNAMIQRRVQQVKQAQATIDAKNTQKQTPAEAVVWA